MRIYISPSSQYANVYNAGQGVEGDHCWEIAKKLMIFLEDAGHEVAMPPSKSTTYKQRAQWSNDFNADVHLPIHTNAGGGKGAVVFCHPKNKENEQVVSVFKELSELSPFGGNGIYYRDDLYEINHTQGLCIYCECEFHDNDAGATWIAENHNEIAKAIARGLGVTEVTDSPVKPDQNQAENRSYYVYSGSYADVNNAYKQLDMLDENGYAAFVKEVNGMHRIQIGAFLNHDNAVAFGRLFKSQTGLEYFIE